MVQRNTTSAWLGLLFAGFLCSQGTLWSQSSQHFMMQLPKPVPGTRLNVETERGADFGEKLRSCIRRLVPDGGTCDALSISGKQTTKENPFKEAVGPLRVLLGNAVIEVMQPWDLPNDIELAGKGSNTVLRLAPGVNSDLIRNVGGRSGNRGIMIHDLTLDGNSANETGIVSTIHFINVNSFTIERIRVLNSVIHGIALDDGCMHGRILNNHIEGVTSGSGIRAGNTPFTGRVAFLEIKSNEISKVGKGNGIFVLGAFSEEHTHDIHITANTISDVKDTSIEVGDGAREVTVTDNKITLKRDSSGSTGISARSARKIHIGKNTITGQPAGQDQTGLHVLSPATDKGGTLTDVTLEDNTVSDVGGYGIKVQAGSMIRILNNTVRHSATGNIEVSPKATGVVQQGNHLE